MPSIRLKPKSKSLLKELVGRSGLVSLLVEVRALSPEDFQAVLEDASGKPAAGKKKIAPSKRTPKLSKDSPIVRVANVLKGELGLSDLDAQLWLRSALKRDGVDASLLPPAAERSSLEAWLDVLFRTVQSSVAYDVAKAGLGS